MPSISRLALPLILLLPVFTSAAAVPGAQGVQRAGHSVPGGVALPPGANNEIASKIQNAIERITAVAGPGAVPPNLEALLQKFEGGATGSTGAGIVGTSPPIVGPASSPPPQGAAPPAQGANTQAGAAPPTKGVPSGGSLKRPSNAVPPVVPGVSGTNASTPGVGANANHAVGPGVVPSQQGGASASGTPAAPASPATSASTQGGLPPSPGQGPPQMQRRQDIASVIEGIINKISSIAGPGAVPPQLQSLLQQFQGGAPAAAAPIAASSAASLPPAGGSNKASSAIPSQGQAGPAGASSAQVPSPQGVSAGPAGVPSSQVCSPQRVPAGLAGIPPAQVPSPQGVFTGPARQRRQDIASVIQGVINKITSIAGPGAVPANLQALLQQFEGAGATPPSAGGANSAPGTVPPPQGNAAPAAGSAGTPPTVGNPATASQMQRRESYDVTDILESIVNKIVSIVGPDAIPPQLQEIIQQLEGGGSPATASSPSVGPAGVPGADPSAGSNTTTNADPNADSDSGVVPSSTVASAQVPSGVPPSQAPGGVPSGQAADGASPTQGAGAGSVVPSVTSAAGLSALSLSASPGPTSAPGPSKRMFARDDDGFAGLFGGGFASIASDFINVLPSDVAAPVKSLENEFIASSSTSSTSTSSTSSASPSPTSSTAPSPSGNSAVGRLSVSGFSLTGAVAVLGSILLGSAIAL